MHQFRKLLTREQIFTIPNFMSFFRLVLVPFIIWTYCKGAYDVAAGLVLLSAATDILDGVIARRFNMISDLGKVLDPLCDKITHAALLVCLATRYVYVWIIFGLLAVKEITMVILGAITIQRKAPIDGAKWYGKLCTVVIETVMLLLILFPQIPARAAVWMLGLCGVVMVFSLIMYIIFFVGVIRSNGKES